MRFPPAGPRLGGARGLRSAGLFLFACEAAVVYREPTADPQEWPEFGTSFVPWLLYDWAPRRFAPSPGVAALAPAQVPRETGADQR
jgi:hypothetical protein